MAVRVHLVAGARPNFMKIAPLWHALKRQGDAFAPVIVHTGQHYDADMSEVFLRQFGLPAPDHLLGAGSGSHGAQTAAVLIAYETVCLADRPDQVVVVGDVNSTLASALVAAKLGIPVAHLEAGLRSFDRAMPEEINRVATDAIADHLWTPSPDADANLLSEGIAPERIERVGNIMIDALEMLRPQIEADGAAQRRGLSSGGYVLATLHRPANVDDPGTLAAIADALVALSRRLPVVFPVHPRTRARLSETGLIGRLRSEAAIRLDEPLGYVEFMSLVLGARLVLTDSGGVQEETTYLGIPCLTLRETTERPITVAQGSNRLVRLDTLSYEIERVLAAPARLGRCPELWDGRTADRVAASLMRLHDLA